MVRSTAVPGILANRTFGLPGHEHEQLLPGVWIRGLKTMEQVGLAAATHDVTLWSLFMQAGFVVKLVMLGLIAASVWTWAIVVDKTLNYGRVRRQLDSFEQVFWSGQSLEELYRTLADRQTAGMGAIFVSAMREWKKSFERGARSPIGLQMRIDRAMDVTLARETEFLGARLGSLATIGSAGPFIGLFGTVYGIMNSFIGIANTNTTNLAVVAPGIAEALLATGIGLFAAIPAVIFYNYFQTRISAYGTRSEGFVAELTNAISRQLDKGA
jgi:biopolymer transport protein TolQ